MVIKTLNLTPMTTTLSSIILEKINGTSSAIHISAWLGCFSIVPSIIFGVKVYTKQHKFTDGDIALIIVGLFPIISAIVFVTLSYEYTQNNLAPEIPKNLKNTAYMNNNNIEILENNNSIAEKEKEFNPLNSIVGIKQNQIQNQQKPK